MLALGLMSGTSADGVSVALISAGKTIGLVGFTNYNYPPALRNKVLGAANLRAGELSKLNFELGEFFALCASDFLTKLRVPAKKVSVIGSHGQTIYHGPGDSPKNTMQLAEPSVIAERLGIPVVADFRPRDIASGGEGAPLIPFFDWYCYKKSAPLILLNLGGIANVTLVTASPENVMGFDTGPANCLIDLAVSIKTKGRQLYDAGGTLAFKGKTDEAAVKNAMNHPYFRKAPPKSTGRELFDEKFLRRYFGAVLRRSLEDCAATLASFTAKTVFSACNDFILKKNAVSKLIASGGGANNVYILSQLGLLFKNARKDFHLSAEDEIPMQAKEPMAFALMAAMAVQGKPNHIPSATGAKSQRILGAIHAA